MLAGRRQLGDGIGATRRRRRRRPRRFTLRQRVPQQAPADQTPAPPHPESGILRQQFATQRWRRWFLSSITSFSFSSLFNIIWFLSPFFFFLNLKMNNNLFDEFSFDLLHSNWFFGAIYYDHVALRLFAGFHSLRVLLIIFLWFFFFFFLFFTLSLFFFFATNNQTKFRVPSFLKQRWFTFSRSVSSAVCRKSQPAEEREKPRPGGMIGRFRRTTTTFTIPSPPLPLLDLPQYLRLLRLILAVSSDFVFNVHSVIWNQSSIR